MTTPNLNLEEMPQNTLQPSVPFNINMQIIDALLPLVVEDVAVPAPPSTTVGDVGKRWIVPAVGSGEWSSHPNQIALCTGEDLWVYIAPPRFIVAYVIEVEGSPFGDYYRFDGTDWAPL